ncbi:hypothetical protein LOTGIDRAFT_197134 [Lottia gigantea]|uniref:Endoglucanase n=1 Tax=Lottia gigantea TaxID=225164 RepID=V4B5D0_LOTGI|nr:hypothetical protein LOTGIDRAFT_197134 [Lottia gigantea]ESO83674.1 hypothetical protein LOTGIDRAFT_197134 [Lottia gigantea]
MMIVLLVCVVGLSVVSGQHTGGGKPAYNYGDALGKSILFFDAQRSGKLPSNNPIKWRGDSALHDKGSHGEDLTGGWYDAGDNVKFNLPMASSTTLLLWGFIQWKDAYQSSHQINQMYDSVKWPLDYFLKCWNPHSQTYYAQVGNGNADHSFWGRPEDMTMARPAYKVTASKPGSDVAGGTAAALAAGSIAFKSKDHGYSSKLLNSAKSLYQFAKNHKGIYSSSIPEASQFYRSSGYKDELCEAAMWLYKATKDHQYLNDAKSFHENAWAWALSWDDKKIACQMLLYEATKDNQYKQEIEGYFKGWKPGGGIKYTPCGLAWRDQWGSTRYAANTAFMALMAADHGIDALSLRKWAQGQINYILGDNNKCFSYMIGFGKHYPLRPHHRGASCHAHCDSSILHSSAPSPHVLVGALVGGPDEHDKYVDKRDDYVHNEVACDYNAGFQSALAGLTHLVHTNNLPQADKRKCHC